jgi:hypothetical protein
LELVVIVQFIDENPLLFHDETYEVAHPVVVGGTDVSVGITGASLGVTSIMVRLNVLVSGAAMADELTDVDVAGSESDHQLSSFKS